MAGTEIPNFPDVLYLLTETRLRLSDRAQLVKTIFASVIFSFVCPSLANALTKETRSTPSTQHHSSIENRVPIRSLPSRLLGFEPVSEQTNGDSQFISKGTGYQLAIGPDKAQVLVPEFKTHLAKVDRIQMRLVGSDPTAKPLTQNALDGTRNYLSGNDPTQWRTGIQRYQRIQYKQVYPGVDLIYYADQAQIEYDFVVGPGADANQIRLRFDSARGVQLDSKGNLRLAGKSSAVSLHRPLVYQNIDGVRKNIQARFKTLAKNEIGFALGEYDKTHPMVIDPVLVYSTYVGGAHDDVVTSGVLDADGNTYITGHTASADLITSANAVQRERQASNLLRFDTFVMKIDPSGAVVYSIFLGGQLNEKGGGIAVDASKQVYVTGATDSSDFPTTVNGYQRTFGGSTDAYLAVLSADGSRLTYSTFLGGTGYEAASSVALGATGATYVGGTARDMGFPVTTGAFQTIHKGGENGFVTKFDTTKSGNASLVFSTLLGGSSTDRSIGGLFAIAVDSLDRVWAAGQTQSADFPVTPTALIKTVTLESSCGATANTPHSYAFVSHLSADGKSLLYSTFLGGSTKSTGGCDQYANQLFLDSNGDVVVAGATPTSNFPTKNPFQSTHKGGNYDAYITKIAADGSQILYSTYFGGMGDDFSGPIAASSGGNIAFTLNTASTDLSTTVDAIKSTNSGGFDIFLGTIKPDGSSPSYATYLGGGGADGAAMLARGLDNNIRVTGGTTSVNFPVTANAFQSQFYGGVRFFDGNDILFAVIGDGVIGGVSPSTAGNAADSTITVLGTGLKSGASCKLVSGATTLIADETTISTDGGSASCRFNLVSAAAGTYDVVITNPNGATLLSKSAFTVQAGGQPKPWINVLGPSGFRVGSFGNFFITVGNSGTVDAYFTTVWIAAPSVLTYALPITTKTGTVTLVDPVTDSNIISSYESGGVRYIPIFIPILPAGNSRTLNLRVKDSSEHANVKVTGYVESPWFNSLATAQAALAAAATNPGTVPNACVSGGAGSGLENCLGKWLKLGSDAVTDALKAGGNNNAADIASKVRLVNSNFASGLLAEISPSVTPTSLQKVVALGGKYQPLDGGIGGTWTGPFTGLGNALSSFTGPGQAANSLNNASSASSSCCGNTQSPSSTTNSGTAKSQDPNDKFGAAGDGSAGHFFRADNPMTYTVAFENQPTATLAAADVVVTDQLDATKFNLNTLTLGQIRFGNNVVDVPAGHSNFSTVFPINASMSVRIVASFDSATGLLRWTFTTIDPTTGLPPSDSTLGFLPPDTDGIVGQGYVAFSLSPKDGLAEGTQIDNKASIVFDTNTPIETPTWRNTIDRTAPQSSVQPLSATQANADFAVSWSSTDGGAGGSAYDVYVADNGGPFSLWQRKILASSATYPGVAGHQYSFYSVATDGAGNSEAGKSAAEASTTVSANGSSGGGGGGGGGCSMNSQPRSFDPTVLLLVGLSLLAIKRRTKR